MKLLATLHTWHKSSTGLLVFGLVELALAYGAVSWAIDSGSLLAWFLTFVLLIGALHNFVNLTFKLFRKMVHNGR